MTRFRINWKCSFFREPQPLDGRLLEQGLVDGTKDQSTPSSTRRHVPSKPGLRMGAIRSDDHPRFPQRVAVRIPLVLDAGVTGQNQVVVVLGASMLRRLNVGYGEIANPPVIEALASVPTAQRTGEVVPLVQAFVGKDVGHSATSALASFS